MDAVTRQNVDRIVDTVTRAFDVEKIFLFGSRARGDSRGDSDYDLLVVVNMEGVPLKKRAYRIRKLFPSRAFGLDVIVKSPHEFEDGRRTRNHICSIVDREGVAVYGK